MDLGSSIRRRRRSPRSKGQAKTKAKRPKPEPKPKRRRAPIFARRAKKKKRSRPGRSWPRKFVLALVVVAVGTGGGYLTATKVLFPLPELPTDLQDVPDLRGAPLQSVLAVLADSGLVVERIDSLRHPTIPAGVVVGQSPLPGPTALPGAALRIAVSVGPEIRLVPDVRTWQEDRAAALMTESGFNVQVDTVESTLPAGQIVRTEPVSDVQIPVPSDVLLLVSLGPPTFPLPDLEGLAELEARWRLRVLGLRIADVDRRFSLLNVSAVFGQSPDPGDPVQRGDSVRLVVGREIPGLVGSTLRDPPPPDSGSSARRNEDASGR